MNEKSDINANNNSNKKNLSNLFVLNKRSRISNLNLDKNILNFNNENNNNKININSTGIIKSSNNNKFKTHYNYYNNNNNFTPFDIKTNNKQNNNNNLLFTHKSLFNNNMECYPLKIDKNKECSINDYLKDIKSMLLHKNYYRKYFEEYNNITQFPSFKVPDVEYYPVYTNSHLIPTNRNIFSNFPYIKIDNKFYSKRKNVNSILNKNSDIKDCSTFSLTTTNLNYNKKKLENNKLKLLNSKSNNNFNNNETKQLTNNNESNKEIIYIDEYIHGNLKENNQHLLLNNNNSRILSRNYNENLNRNNNNNNNSNYTKYVDGNNEYFLADKTIKINENIQTNIKNTSIKGNINSIENNSRRYNSNTNNLIHNVKGHTNNINNVLKKKSIRRNMTFVNNNIINKEEYDKDYCRLDTMSNQDNFKISNSKKVKVLTFSNNKNKLISPNNNNNNKFKSLEQLDKNNNKQSNTVTNFTIDSNNNINISSNIIKTLVNEDKRQLLETNLYYKKKDTIKEYNSAYKITLKSFSVIFNLIENNNNNKNYKLITKSYNFILPLSFIPLFINLNSKSIWDIILSYFIVKDKVVEVNNNYIHNINDIIDKSFNKNIEENLANSKNYNYLNKEKDNIHKHKASVTNTSIKNSCFDDYLDNDNKFNSVLKNSAYKDSNNYFNNNNNSTIINNKINTSSISYNNKLTKIADSSKINQSNSINTGNAKSNIYNIKNTNNNDNNNNNNNNNDFDLNKNIKENDYNHKNEIDTQYAYKNTNYLSTLWINISSIFEVIIKPPEIEFKFENILFKHEVEPSVYYNKSCSLFKDFYYLIFNNYTSNYKNWEYNALNYISYQLSFRYIINKIIKNKQEFCNCVFTEDKKSINNYIVNYKKENIIENSISLNIINKRTNKYKDNFYYVFTTNNNYFDYFSNTNTNTSLLVIDLKVLKSTNLNLMISSKQKKNNIYNELKKSCFKANVTTDLYNGVIENQDNIILKIKENNILNTTTSSRMFFIISTINYNKNTLLEIISYSVIKQISNQNTEILSNIKGSKKDNKIVTNKNFIKKNTIKENVNINLKSEETEYNNKALINANKLILSNYNNNNNNNNNTIKKKSSKSFKRLISNVLSSSKLINLNKGDTTNLNTNNLAYKKNKFLFSHMLLKKITKLDDKLAFDASSVNNIVFYFPFNYLYYFNYIKNFWDINLVMNRIINYDPLNMVISIDEHFSNLCKNKDSLKYLLTSNTPSNFKQNISNSDDYKTIKDININMFESKHNIIKDKIEETPTKKITSYNKKNTFNMSLQKSSKINSKKFILNLDSINNNNNNLNCNIFKHKNNYPVSTPKVKRPILTTNIKLICFNNEHNNCLNDKEYKTNTISSKFRSNKCNLIHTNKLFDSKLLEKLEDDKNNDNVNAKEKDINIDNINNINNKSHNKTNIDLSLNHNKSLDICNNKKSNMSVNNNNNNNNSTKNKNKNKLFDYDVPKILIHNYEDINNNNNNNNDNLEYINIDDDFLKDLSLEIDINKWYTILNKHKLKFLNIYKEGK